MEVVSPFRIPATVLVENQGRRVLKNGNSFAVLVAFGNAQAAGPAAEGLFSEDTRHVSRLVTSIDGIRPLLLSSAVTADNAMLLVDLTNPDLIDKGELRQATSTLHLLSTIALDEDALLTTVEIRNFGTTPTGFARRSGHAGDRTARKANPLYPPDPARLVGRGPAGEFATRRGVGRSVGAAGRQ